MFCILDYQFVAKALSGEEIDEQVFEQQSTLLELFAEELIKTLKPLEILPHLSTRGLINEMDTQEISAEARNQGDIAAMIVLIDRIGKKKSTWYREFLDVLCETEYQHLARLIDPDHLQSMIYSWIFKMRPC